MPHWENTQEHNFQWSKAWRIFSISSESFHCLWFIQKSQDGWHGWEELQETSEATYFRKDCTEICVCPEWEFFLVCGEVALLPRAWAWNVWTISECLNRKHLRWRPRSVITRKAELMCRGAADSQAPHQTSWIRIFESRTQKSVSRNCTPTPWLQLRHSGAMLNQLGKLEGKMF